MDPELNICISSSYAYYESIADICMPKRISKLDDVDYFWLTWLGSYERKT